MEAIFIFFCVPDSIWLQANTFLGVETISAPLLPKRGHFLHFCSTSNWPLHLYSPILPMASSSIINAEQ